MIFARRVTAVLLGGFFLAGLLVALIVLRMSETVLKPEFYPEQVEKSGAYRFVMRDVLTSALDEAWAIEAEDFGAEMSGNLLDVTGLTNDQVTEAVNLAMSPQDLQEIADPAIYRVGQYVSAERDAVTIRIKADEHIKDAAYEVHQLMQEAGAYERILEREVEPRIQKAIDEAFDRNGQVSGWAQYLFGNDMAAREKFVRAVMNTITPDWVADQVEAALEPVTSYLVGESDGFEISVRFTDAQMVTTSDEIAALLREVDTYDLVYTGVVESVVKDTLGAKIDLPYGLTVTDDEVVDALRLSAQPGLVHQQAESLADAIGLYVSGRSDRFSVNVSLSQNKREAAAILTELVGLKVVEAFSGLPVCATEVQTRDAVGRISRQLLPPCIPPGITAANIREQGPRTIGELVRSRILAPVPDIITFSASDLRTALRDVGGPEALVDFDRLRRLPGRRWSYTQDDLRADLEGRGNVLRIIHVTRTLLTDGYILSDRVRPKGRLGRRIDTALDAVRDLFNFIRSYQWAAYATVPALLIVVGVLGGTTWRGRVMWASATLFVSSTVVFILAWPVYDVVAGEVFSDWRGKVAGTFEGPFEETLLLIATWSADMIEAVADEFVSGVRAYSLVLAALSLTVLLCSTFWDRLATMLRKPSTGDLS